MILEEHTLPMEFVTDCTNILMGYGGAYRELCEERRVGNLDDYDDAINLHQFGMTYAMIKHSSSPLDGKRVLHLAANLGLFLEFLVKNEGVTGSGIDKSTMAVNFAKQHTDLDLVVGGAESLPSSLTGPYDIVIAHQFFDPDYLRGERIIADAVKEAFKVLDDGGRLVICNGSVKDYMLIGLPIAKVVNYTNGALRNSVIHKC
jgi:SAM-dependent methyltransferase